MSLLSLFFTKRDTSKRMSTGCMRWWPGNSESLAEINSVLRFKVVPLVPLVSSRLNFAWLVKQIGRPEGLAENLRSYGFPVKPSNRGFPRNHLWQTLVVSMNLSKSGS